MSTRHEKETEEAPRRTVLLDLPVYEKAAAIAKHKYDMPLRKFVNEYLGNAFRREELLERFRPFLTIVHTEGNSMYMKDSKLNKVVEVALLIKENDNVSLQCAEDKTNDCIHVSFALESNDLGKLDAPRLIESPGSNSDVLLEDDNLKIRRRN